MLADILARRPVKSVADAILTMTDIDQLLANDDGLERFNKSCSHRR